MHAASLRDLVAQCSGLCLRQDSDAALLGRFVAHRDAAAFARLVERHAALVWGVCRRLLRSEPDCEDAFQATFLALARQAAGLDERAPLGCWLHTAAYRVARKTQVRSWRRGAEPLPAEHPDTKSSVDVGQEVSSRELLRMVDEEIAKLPSALRGPLVLCCLEGKARDEAAVALGCSLAAIKARLERARGILRQRLERRGVELPAALLVLGMGAAPVRAAVLEQATASALGGAKPAVVALAAAATPGAGKLLMAGVVLTVSCALALVLSFAQAGGLAGVQPAALDAPEAPVAVVAQPEEQHARRDAIGDPLPEAARLRLGTSRFRHPESAWGLALAPDGKTVMTIGWQGLFAWDTATGKERWHAEPRALQQNLNPAVGAIRLVITPDGKRCITPARTIGFTTWDIGTGQATTIPVHIQLQAKLLPLQFTSLDISPDGKTLALGCSEVLVLCDLAGNITARIGMRPPPPPGAPDKDRLLASDGFSYGRFAPDGKSLAVVTNDAPDVVKMCALDGRELRRLQLSKNYLDGAFSPDGKLLAVAERDDAVRVYHVATGKRAHNWPVQIRDANENYVFQVLFAPDGKSVVASSSDRLIRVWDAVSGAESAQLNGHSWYPWGLAFTRDSQTLYSTGWDGEIRRWDLGTHKQLPLPVGVRGSARVATAPDGRTVVYVDGDGQLRFVDTKDGRELLKLAAPNLNVSRLEFSRDARSLALGGTQGDDVVVAVLDLASSKITHRWQWPKGRPHVAVEDLVFTADGQRLAAMIFRQGQARVWNLRRQDETLMLPHQEGYGLDFSPDGTTLATAGWDKKLRFWDTATGKLTKEHTATPPTQSIPGAREITDTRLWDVAYAPDGSRIVAVDMNGLLWSWDADTMKLRFVVHTGDIFRYNCLTYSRDGLWLATGGAGGKPKVWDAATGQLVWERGKHTAMLYTVGFSQGSRRLLSGGSDGLGYLWELRPKEVPAKRPEALWNDLIGADGPAAYGAFWALIDGQPDAAVAILREQGNVLLAKADGEQLQKWVGELDDANFARREAAVKGLEKHLHAALPFMRRALAKPSSLEQQRRLERLLDQAGQFQSRVGRAASVLAHINTPAARRLLSEWAQADRDGPLGRAAALLK
jgi:RNA polymerase sigma factor (sigma-70 family)